ncbi:hypothetical protein [Streptomyces sp. NPDC051994]|uniref:hypothetical protein n=1 Tax=unclassified Streptomyces TaxID=2593676 RepID=UPI0034198D1F
MGTNYYVQTSPCENACDHCAESDRIHLGKASTGWRFTFQAHESWPTENAFTEWLKVAMSGPISDEYGREIRLTELLSLIYAKEDGKSHAAEYPSGSYQQDGHSFTVHYFS